MKINFYNSLTHRIEEFHSIRPQRVLMYSCGPTVYDFAHIGNFRTFLFGDLLRRFLELAGYQVRQVMNITDVGHMTDGETDRMTEAAQRMKENKKSGRVAEGAVENPDDPYQIADYYIEAFLEDARKLGYKIAFEYPQMVPRATDHIADMQRMINTLLNRGHAYIASDGVVYFSVESFPKYGQLSGNTLDQLQSGAGGRVAQENQANKKHPADFMLWKPDPRHIMKWDSPWGTGYPGWHIECSAMATKLLGSEIIDIHTGGEDLIFPHHECEIAQSCGASGNEVFARYWIHARFLFVEGEKMSKTRGNFYTARDVFEKKVTDSPVDPAVLRYELLKSHYRANMNFTKKGLIDSANDVRKLIEFRQRLVDQTQGQSADVDLSHPVLNEFASALADDLNMAGALGVIYPWIKSPHNDPRQSLGVWKRINSVLSVAPINEERRDDAGQSAGDSLVAQVEQWCQELDAARAAKDFPTADAIRTKIKQAGFEVRTTKEGTKIQKQLV